MAASLEKPTYEDAVRRLNSTQTGYKLLDERRRRGELLTNDAVDIMLQWLKRIGYAASDLDRLNVVHVAGTKGKGTTCAFVNSILQHYQYSIGLPRKIGLYTSPHLLAVRERIRINSEPISEEKFAKYFFEVWNALESSAHKEGLDPELKPTYFRFLTLLSFHVFMREGVDTAIYEVGVGGELDSTNIFVKPAVTGITTLEIDHVITLGDTIDQIAWHKSGIFKRECPAFTVEQVPDAMKVLEERALERDVKLTKVHVSPLLEGVDIRPGEHFQKKNASLAIELANTVLKKLDVESAYRSDRPLPASFVRGLENIVWRGRCEALTIGNLHWRLDGAHTEDSLRVASSWFARISQSKKVPHILIFNQQSTRDSVSLLKAVHHTLSASQVTLRYALFCTNATNKGYSYKADFVNLNINPSAIHSLSHQKELAAVWHDLDPKTHVVVQSSIEEAIDYVKDLNDEIEADEMNIFVTGSFHLVGGALSILEGEDFSLVGSSRE